MTKEELSKLQKEIAQEIIKISQRKICPRRYELLKELNLRLDSINRSAFYLMKEPQ